MEPELKPTVSPDLVRPLRKRLARWGDGERARLESIYYDTADTLLLHHGMSLLVRKNGRQRVQTIKTNGGRGAVHRRGEWEIPTRRNSPVVSRFGRTPLARLLARHPGAKLLPLFRTTVSRTTWKVESNDATIEVALDQGYVRSQSDSAAMALCELELELKAGDLRALPAFALELQRSLGER